MKCCLVRKEVKWRKVEKILNWLAVLCGENHTVIALFIFSIKMFEIYALILGCSAYWPNRSWTAIAN
jgi:hypothetical protein